MSAHADTHDHDEDHGHHHKETFVTKYIFSQDHKMIAKQYLITGTIMGVIGVLMSHDVSVCKLHGQKNQM